MKTILLAATSCILVMSAVGSHADAHPAQTTHNLRVRDFQAMSATHQTATVVVDGGPLRGSTNDQSSTATGGPVGGLPDRN